MVIVLDSFEDGDLSEYTKQGRRVVGITQSPVYDGNNAYKGRQEIIDENEELGTVQQGDTFSAFTRATHAQFATHGINFGVQDIDNFYYVIFTAHDPDDPSDRGIVKLKRESSGEITTLEDAELNWEPDTWYETKVSWGNDGTIDVTIYEDGSTEVASLSATDTTYSSGGIGFNASGLAFFASYGFGDYYTKEVPPPSAPSDLTATLS